MPVHKKNSRKKCGNYRGISVCNDHVRCLTEDRLLEEQAGFRSGRGCIDQIFVIRQLMEKYLEKDKKMYAAFIDMEKVYDKVWRQTCGQYCVDTE